MKRGLILLLTLLVILSLIACDSEIINTADTNNLSTAARTAEDVVEEVVENSTEKIAIITMDEDMQPETYHSALAMAEKYPVRVVHEVWYYPKDRIWDSSLETEIMMEIFDKIAANQSIRALIINTSLPCEIAAIEKLLETRDDLLIISCTPNVNPDEISKVADIVLDNNWINQSVAMAKQAHEMGTKTFVYYYLQRNMAVPSFVAKHDILKAEFERLGIEFVSVAAHTPYSSWSVVETHTLQDVPEKVAQYGKDTAFFATDCRLQSALIMAVLEEGAIFPSSCCPSPYHGFPAALKLEYGFYLRQNSYVHPDIDIMFDAGFDNPQQMADLEFIHATIEQINNKIADAGMSGRISTWPFPRDILNTLVTVDYAFKWMADETNGKVDVDVIRELIEAYTGTGVDIELYTEEDITYDNYILYMQPYITFR